MIRSSMRMKYFITLFAIATFNHAPTIVGRFASGREVFRVTLEAAEYQALAPDESGMRERIRDGIRAQGKVLPRDIPLMHMLCGKETCFPAEVGDEVAVTIIETRDYTGRKFPDFYLVRFNDIQPGCRMQLISKNMNADFLQGEFSKQFFLDILMQKERPSLLPSGIYLTAMHIFAFGNYSYIDFSMFDIVLNMNEKSLFCIKKLSSSASIIIKSLNNHTIVLAVYKVFSKMGVDFYALRPPLPSFDLDKVTDEHFMQYELNFEDKTAEHIAAIERAMKP